MTRFWNLALVCGLVTLFSSANQLVARDTSTEQAGASATKAESDMGMMGQMDPAMKMKCMMMMKMEVKPTDPGALLAIKDKLGLSEQQIKMLEQIQESSQELADEMLEPEQREKLDGLAALPDTPMAMHVKMMAMMKEKMSGSSGKGGMMMGKKGGMMGKEKGAMMGQGKDGMMCPMMQAMKEMKDESSDSGSDKMSDMKEKMKSRMQEKMKDKHSGHH